MVLKVGTGGKVRLMRFVKTTNMFECGENGMVVELENKMVTMYVTNGACSEIYATIPLGTEKALKKYKFVCIAYSEDKMLLDGGDIHVVVDYAAQKVAVSKPELSVTGKGWGDDPRMPWQPQFNAMFGLPVGELTAGNDPAADFWKWFSGNESAIREMVSAGGEDARTMNMQISQRLAPVFPYEKEEDIEFRLDCGENGNVFSVFHFNNEQMKADALALGRKMPEALGERWQFDTQA